MRAGFTEFNAHIDALNAKIDMLQRGVWCVIWTLIGLLVTTVFGLLYMVVAGS